MDDATELKVKGFSIAPPQQYSNLCVSIQLRLSVN